MKNNVSKLILSGVIAALASSSLYSQSLATYEFTGGSAVATGVASNLVANDAVVNRDPSSPTTSSAISITSNNYFLRAEATGSTATSTEADLDYLEITLTAVAGHVINLNSVTWNYWATTNGGAIFNAESVLFSSVAGLNSRITTASNTAITVSTGSNPSTSPEGNTALYDVTSNNSFKNLSSVTFRFKVFDNANSTSSINRFDNITFNGSVDAIPEPSAAILVGFGVLALLRRRR
jgi:hypothetical protein